MNSADLISMGIKNLLRRKTRTILTVLGVVIGTASIVVMMSLGIGMNRNFEEQLKNMGSLNIIDVSPNYGFIEPGKPAPVPGDSPKLNDETVARIEQIPGVDAVMPIIYQGMQINAGRYYSYLNVNGIDMSKADFFDFQIEQGRLPDGTAKYELLFGSGIKDSFYDPKSRVYTGPPQVDLMTARLLALPDNVDITQRPRGVKVEATGLLIQSNNERDWTVYMDVAQMLKLKEELAKLSGGGGGGSGGRVRPDPNADKYSQLKVKVNDINKVQAVQQTIKDMGLQAWSLSDILESMKQTTAGIRAVLGGIGAVSLFVAALGITNTMVMSIYERTREIGVMKVLGAELPVIKKLFLFEAGMIGFFGGLFGLVLSYLISWLVNSVGVSLFNIGWGETTGGISFIPVWLSSAALAFATVVGIAAGYYPALRAMHLSALEAIRNE
jgi:ABC-type antimicrobial peptide transport system permease subunit